MKSMKPSVCVVPIRTCSALQRWALHYAKRCRFGLCWPDGLELDNKPPAWGAHCWNASSVHTVETWLRLAGNRQTDHPVLQCAQPDWLLGSKFKHRDCRANVPRGKKRLNIQIHVDLIRWNATKRASLMGWPFSAPVYSYPVTSFRSHTLCQVLHHFINVSFSGSTFVP